MFKLECFKMFVNMNLKETWKLKIKGLYKLEVWRILKVENWKWLSKLNLKVKCKTEFGRIFLIEIERTSQNNSLTTKC